ncbi:Biosynthetic arginine decarboxylase [Poriferisphaera corsica]|uniref:Biosynthetic arginine decarboxylase n=1 Tax=Poriferisphaera corsica TaxID=2528020 RepID=A0A517YUY8_9BACT|nr:biosynthetic arginine decarboxylase [Poriferisphaera corsica]QDU34069.1 Biosynthetic arginine decarboxylase [Poriferisphaera corsica]
MRTFTQHTTQSTDWSLQQSADLYRIPAWGKGYFGINDLGHLTVHPKQDAPPPSLPPSSISPSVAAPSSAAIDLKELIDQLRSRDIHTPILLRFTDLLRERLAEIASAFQTAITENDYQSNYCAVYPVKVNQQRHVVEEVLGFCKQHNFGIEAGSKPELLAVLALVTDNDTPIICNGFKDDAFIEAVILASKIGRNIIPVVEKLSELRLIIRCAKKHNVRPRIGVRVKLATTAASKWEDSGGMRSKFGLFISELLDAIEILRSENMLDCLQLLHSHIGSQLSDSAQIKRAVNELARVYCELHKSGASMQLLDVGGGFGVDYDGSQSTAHSSINYTPQEYANNIIFHIKEACDAAQVPHPTIISESGRAMVAYSSVLVFDILGWSGFKRFPLPEATPKNLEDLIKPVQTLYETFAEINTDNYIEYYHDAQMNRDEALSLFNLGYGSLQERGLAEKLFFGICSKVLTIVKTLPDMPEEFANLEAMLADTYFINGSVFQSLPDSWAIEQMFPIAPIHRLDQEPTCRGKLVDITCDSDGRIEKFIDATGTKDVLELHTLTDDPYYIAVFLVGAYQEILGDLHNLFGDTNAVHVSLDDNNQVSIDEVVEGDTVSEVLRYVQYEPEELRRNMRRIIEQSIKNKKLTVNEGKALRLFYEQGLAGTTYLNPDSNT